MVPGRLVSLQLVASVLVSASAAPLRAAEAEDSDDPSVTTTVAAPAPRTARAKAGEGLDHRWLPLESRTSLLDYVARNVPGAMWGADGGLRLRGGEARDSAVFADGFRLRRPALPIGVVGQASVLTAGYGADLGDVPGGAVVTELRSGTNALEADADVFRELGEPSATAVAATVAGPLVRDRLFVLFGVRGTDARGETPTDPSGYYPPAPPPTGRDLASALKVTWRPAGNHRFDSLTLLDAARVDSGGGVTVAPDAQPTRTARGLFTSVRWIGKLGPLQARSQVAFDHARSDLEPRLCREKPAECEQSPPLMQLFPSSYLEANGTLREQRTERQWQVASGLEARLSESGVVAQTLRLTSRVTLQSFEWSQSIPGNNIRSFIGRMPDRQVEAFANDPRLASPVYGSTTFSGSTLQTFHTLEDQLRLFDRWWLFPGIGLAAGRSRSADGHLFRGLAFTHHLGLAWDVGGNGRTWLRASSHRRAQPELESVTRFALGTPVQTTCRWNQDTMTFSDECRDSGGSLSRSVGLPCSPAGVSDGGDPCRRPLAIPRTWEHTFGLTRAVTDDLDVALDMVYRRTTNLPLVVETNRVWSYQDGPLVINRPYLNGRDTFVQNWSTSVENQRRSLAGTVSLSKRAGAFRAFAAYTLSRLQGNLPSFSAPAPTDGYGGGFLLGLDPQDRTHGFRLLATYDLLGHLTFGLVYARDSGAIFRRVYYPARRSGSTRTPFFGVNPGISVNDPTDDAILRTPDVERLNLQARWRLRPLLRADVDFYVDAINLRDEAFVDTSDSPSFAPGPRLRPPRWYRLAAEYRF
jgi:hypothetical protein